MFDFALGQFHQILTVDCHLKILVNLSPVLPADSHVALAHLANGDSVVYPMGRGKDGIPEDLQET